MDRLDFVWDETKAGANFIKHGLAFEDAVLVFMDAARVEFDVSRAGDGEIRRKVVGAVQGRVITAVYTLRGGRIRLISARRANIPETRRYER